MDPNFIGTEEWSRIFDLVHVLWLLPIGMIGFAFFLLVGQAVLPSLVATGDLSPDRGRMLRRAVLTVSMTSLLLLVWIAITFVDRMDIIEEIYPSWWI
jgi:hypothetical protein